jgi:tetratricopeptide (TPR) repeat protein
MTMTTKTRVFWIGGLALGACLLASQARAQRGIAQGRVIDENGEGVAKVTVVFDRRGGFEQHYQTRTDDKGRYTQIVEPGLYRITGSREGYQGGYLDETIPPGAPTRVPDLQIVSQEKAMAAAIEQDAVLGPLKRAMELTRDGRLEEAEAAYKEVLEKDPSVVEAHYNLGSIYLGQENFAAAADEFQKAIDLRPDSGDAYRALSRVYEKKGNTDQAITVMEKGVAVRPEDPVMQFDLGILHYNARHTAEAEAAFHKVETLDPGNVRIQYLLATLALNRGDAEEAVTRLDEYLAKAPENAPERETAKKLLDQLRP